MIEHNWSVLCELGSVDGDTNQVSLFNVIEGLSVMGDPSKIKRFPRTLELFSSWTKSNLNEVVTGTMRVSLLFPSGNIKEYNLGLKVDLSEALFFHTRIHIQGFPIEGPGIYRFAIEMQEDGSEERKRITTLPIFIEYKTDKISKPNGVKQQE